METACFGPFLLQMSVLIYPPGSLSKEKSNPAKAVDWSLTRRVGASVRNAWVWGHGWLWESGTLEVQVQMTLYRNGAAPRATNLHPSDDIWDP